MSSLWWRLQTSNCSAEELSEIITAPNGGYYALPTDPFNEVFPGIIIGDGYVDHYPIDSIFLFLIT